MTQPKFILTAIFFVLLCLVLYRCIFEHPASLKEPASITMFPTTCLGETVAKKNIIFLHGIMPDVDLLPKEYDYRPVMERLAKDLNLRIAMPRSTQICPSKDGHLCWHANDNYEIQRTYEILLNSVAKCFSPDAEFSMMGFSNGGYFVAKVAMQCLKPKANWILAIGSSGDVDLAASNDLSNCPPLDLLIGKRDITRQKAKLFAEELKEKKLQVNFQEFDGGHDILYQPIYDFLKRRK